MRRHLVIRTAVVVLGTAVLLASVSSRATGSRFPPDEAGSLNASPSQIEAVGLDGRKDDLGGNPGGASDGPASLSPDRSRIVFERGGDLWLMNADGSGQHLLFTTPSSETLGGGSFVAPWSPDGKRLAIRLWDSARGGEWWLISADSSDQRLLLSPTADESLISASSTPAWSPDGSRLALETYQTCYTNNGADACTQTGYSVLVDLNANQLGRAGLYPVWSPDGSEIASEPATSGCVVVRDAAGRRLRWNPRAAGLPSGACPLPRWAPDGRWVAAESRRGVLYLVPRRGGKAHKVASANDLSWSPDGSRLALWRGDALYLARGDGTHPSRLAKHADTASLWWSPTGSWLAFTDTYRLWIATRDGRHLREIADDTDIPAFGSLYWSPNGQWIAYVSLNGQIAVVALRGGPPRYLTNEPAGSHVSILGWSRDNRYVLYTAGIGDA